MKNITILLICIITLFSCKQEKQLFVGVNSNAVKIDILVPEHGMADPHALVKGDTLFIIAGHDKSWDEPTTNFPMDRWEIWSTTDLLNWTFHKSIFPKDTYIGDKPNCWAGDITERNGKYYWFFSNRNIDTGVVVADDIVGEYKDILGKPLLPKGIVPVHPYDPAIYHENGVYTICFGQGNYYMATLSEDMMSLKTKPKVISVQHQGKEVSTDDKSTLFKRGDWYYLVYGNKYAMSNNLYGPYDFKGNFLEGGHTSFFKWKDGQRYVLQENHEISAFFRGASLKPVFFNEDGTIIIPENDRMYPGPGRAWNFENSTMGWKSPDNYSSVQFKEKGILFGSVSNSNATIVSAPWLYTKTEECSQISLSIKNESSATQLRIAIYSRNDQDPSFWSYGTQPIDWESQQWNTVSIIPNSNKIKTYSIDFSNFNKLENRIMQVAIQPQSNANSGQWQIKNISIK